jgi:hypothetical protein
VRVVLSAPSLSVARIVATLAIVLALVLVLAGAPLTATAQEAPPKPRMPPWVQLTVVEVAPSMVDEFLAVQRELSARAKKAKTPWRIVSRTEVFGDSYRFLIDTPVDKLAVFDKKVDRDPELESLVNRAERCVTHRVSYAVRTFPDVDDPLPEGEPEDLMVVNLVRVFPGREQDYLNVMTTDVLPHFKESGSHHVTGSIALGGESGFIHLFYVKDFAELDRGSPVLRALGPAGAQAVTAKLSGIVASSESWVARVLPDVSYRPQPSASDKP